MRAGVPATVKKAAAKLHSVAAQQAESQVRAVVVCCPPLDRDGQLLPAAGGGDAPSELSILPARAVELSGAEGHKADPYHDITVGKEVLRFPLYGHKGADAAELCEREVAPLLQRLLAGESAAVIAYGQTGSGKSFTMGTEKYKEGQGPSPNSVGSFCSHKVFELANEKGVRDLEVSCAAIEISREGKNKERLFDLLTLERTRIEGFESQATWHRPTSPQQLQGKLLDAALVRNTDRTDGNARSSRSHAIFVIQVQFKRQQEGEGGGVQRIKARLMLVDLAGSERASLAQAGSTTQKQGSGINVGLLYLGMVIKELAERGSTLGYRNSTLTEILKPALGGGSNEVTSSCNSLILGCISPLALHLGNTKSTLEFLQQASTVKNIVRADVQMLRQQELEAQVERLERQLRGMELQLRQQQQQQQQQQQAVVQEASLSGGSSPHGSPQLQQALGAPAAEAASSGGTGTAEAAAGGATGGGEDAGARIAALLREMAALRKEALVQRDRADAFEGLLRQQAAAAATAAEAAAAQPAAEAGAAQPTAAAAGGNAAQSSQDGSAAEPGGIGPAAGSSVADDAAVPMAASPAPLSAAAAAAAAGTAATPITAGRPSAASFLAASPLLAASRDVAEWVADVAAAEAATPAGQRLPLLELLPGPEEICCERDSHMPEDQLAALKDKVEQVLSAAHGKDERAQALAFAQACLYALGTYNTCLGDAITRAEDAEEDRQADQQQHATEFAQLYQEKVAYMRRTAAAEGGLAEYETQVEDLQAKLAAAQEALQQHQQQGTPGRWASLGRLISGGRTPASGGGSGGTDSRRSSRSGSPCASPRASFGGGSSGQHHTVPQQLFASPSRLGHVHSQAQARGDGSLPAAAPATTEAAGAAAAPDFTTDREGRRMTVACVQHCSDDAPRQEHALAAAMAAAQASSLLAKQPKVGTAAAELLADPADSPGMLIKAVLPAPPPAGPAAGTTIAERALPYQGQEHAAQPGEQQKQQAPAGDVAVKQAGQLGQTEGDDVETPLESPEVSCIVADSGSSGGTECTEAQAAQQAAQLSMDCAAEDATDAMVWAAEQLEPAEGAMTLAGSPGAEAQPCRSSSIAAEEDQQEDQADVDMAAASPWQPAPPLQQGPPSSSIAAAGRASAQAAAEHVPVDLDGCLQQQEVTPSASAGNLQQLPAAAQLVQQQQGDKVPYGASAPMDDGAATVESSGRDGSGGDPSWSDEALVVAAELGPGQLASAQQPIAAGDAGREQQSALVSAEVLDGSLLPAEAPAVAFRQPVAHLPAQLLAPEQPEIVPIQQPAPQQQQAELAEQRQLLEQVLPAPREGTQQQEHQQQLPGPCIFVQVPHGRGRRKVMAEYEWQPATGQFFFPESEAQAKPLEDLALGKGEPWQRRVLLKGSTITLEQWLQRRMLRPGCCHICCQSAADPGCCHPEPALSQLQLCQACHTRLGPECWKSSDDWLSTDPADPGFQYCCLCGNDGVGNTTDTVMCSSCKLSGFCTGCLWRFTADDLAAAQQEGALWVCLLCRPEPKLHLAYLEPPAASSSEGSDADAGGTERNSRASRARGSSKLGGTGTRGRGASQAARQQQQLQLLQQAQGTAGLRRSSRRRQAVLAQQEEDVPAEYDCVVDLAGTSSDDAGTPQRQQPVQQQGTRKLPGTQSRSRRQGGAAAADASAGRASELQGGGSNSSNEDRAQQQQQPVVIQATQQQGLTQAAQPGAARKRRLLAHGDIQTSPTGETPLLKQRQLLQQQRRQHGPVNTAAISALRGEGVDYAKASQRNPLWQPGRAKAHAQAKADAFKAMQGL